MAEPLSEVQNKTAGAKTKASKAPTKAKAADKAMSPTVEEASKGAEEVKKRGGAEAKKAADEPKAAVMSPKAADEAKSDGADASTMAMGTTGDAGAAATGTKAGGSKDSKEALLRVEGVIAKIRKTYDSARFGGEWSADETVSAVDALEHLALSEISDAVMNFPGDVEEQWKAAIAMAELVAFIAKDLPVKPGKLAKGKGKNATLNATFKDWLDETLNNYGMELNRVWTHVVLKNQGKVPSKQVMQKARALPSTGLKDLGDIADIFEQFDDKFGKKSAATASAKDAAKESKSD